MEGEGGWESGKGGGKFLKEGEQFECLEARSLIGCGGGDSEIFLKNLTDCRYYVVYIPYGVLCGGVGHGCKVERCS